MPGAHRCLALSGRTPFPRRPPRPLDAQAGSAGNVAERSLVLQGEVFYRTEDGTNEYDAGGAAAYKRNSWGLYGQAVYKFLPQWKVGYRFSTLTPAGTGGAAELVGSPLDVAGHRPVTHSVVLEWDNSEFSSIRLQYNRDLSDLLPNDSVMLRYTAVLGAHGAHLY